MVVSANVRIYLQEIFHLAGFENLDMLSSIGCYV
jgi:hypothetical protein